MFSEGGWHGLDCCHGIEAFSQSSSQPMQSPRKVCWHRSPSAAFQEWQDSLADETAALRDVSVRCLLAGRFHKGKVLSWGCIDGT